VINSPHKNKRSYWSNDSGNLTADSEAWLAGATEHSGSWWPQWAAFLEAHGGKSVKAATKLGNADYPPIEPAPGRYVKVRAD
jgi:polyhydroxyalkanoate synthase subunit PhaC